MYIYIWAKPRHVSYSLHTFFKVFLSIVFLLSCPVPCFCYEKFLHIFIEQTDTWNEHIWWSVIIWRGSKTVTCFTSDELKNSKNHNECKNSMNCDCKYQSNYMYFFIWHYSNSVQKYMPLDMIIYSLRINLKCHVSYKKLSRVLHVRNSGHIFAKNHLRTLCDTCIPM